MVSNQLQRNAVHILVSHLRPAPWNANVETPETVAKVRESIQRFGFVGVLAVRPLSGGGYEVISGNWRLQLLIELGYSQVPCVVLELDDAHARLLSLALNRLHGYDDPGLKAELLREVLAKISRETVISLIPETSESLDALCSMGQEDIASYLQEWQRAREVRLRHVQFQLTASQVEVVDKALGKFLAKARASKDSPNVRGTALCLLCKAYLEMSRV